MTTDERADPGRAMEIAKAALRENERGVPSISKAEDLIAELCDLVGVKEARRLLKNARQEPTPSSEVHRDDPLLSEKEALEMIRRNGIVFKGGELITPQQAADIILNLADRIRQERADAQPSNLVRNQ